MEDLEEKLQNLNNIEAVRDLEKINNELESLKNETTELNTEIKTMKKTISEAVINDEIVNNLEKYKNKIAESRAAIKLPD